MTRRLAHYKMFAMAALLVMAGSAVAWSQLPPEAVMLDKVKIPETSSRIRSTR